MPAGDGVIGNTWTNLQIRGRAGTGADWVSALLNGTIKPDYMAMSRTMQTAIRRWLLVSYASDPTRFKSLPGKNGISAFLVYTSMPAKNGYYLKDPATLSSDPGRILWDVRNVELAKAMTTTFAPQPLAANLMNSSTLDLVVLCLRDLVSAILALAETARDPAAEISWSAVVAGDSRRLSGNLLVLRCGATSSDEPRAETRPFMLSSACLFSSCLRC